MAESKPFRLSASKLKRFLTCPRAYFLKYVAGVEEDVGGNYLVIGTAYDLHVQWYLSRGARGVRSIDPRILRMFDAARRHLPEPGSVEVQTKYSIPHPDGFVVEGTPDLRRPGWLGDTKTTSASGPGVGSAMTAAQLEEDIQFRLYAWCEYELGWQGPPVGGVWSYVNKDTKPKAWNVYATLGQAVVYDWFDTVVRPAAAVMAQLHDETDADRVRAELDSCDRCWVRAHCEPFLGPNNYDEQLVCIRIPTRKDPHSRPSIVPGGQPAPVVVREANTTHGALESVPDGTTTTRSWPMSDDGQDLVSLLTESITRATTSRGMSGGPPPASRHAIAVHDSHESVVRSSGSAQSVISGGRVSATLTSVCSTQPRLQPMPVMPTSANTESGPRSISLDAQVSHVIVEGRRPMSSAKEESQVPFDLSKLSVEEEQPVVESVEIPINPPPAVDYAAELAEAIAQCQTAAQRAGELLARLRGGGQ